MIEKFGLVKTNAKAVQVGQRFGRLLVVDVGQTPGTYKYFAVCACDCGQTCVQRFDNLKEEKVVSCGCYRLDRVTKHGLTKSIHLCRWSAMMRRCYNTKDRRYADYGGRGVKVCERWHDVSVFVLELPEGYFEGAEIDRINNDGDYEPGNVKWSTPKQNSRNRRSNKPLTLNGVTLSQREWAEKLGVDDRLISSRINNLGWSVERALTEPVASLDEVVHAASAARWAGHETKGRPAPKTARRRLSVEFNGRQYTMEELSSMSGITTKDIRRRIFELGWPVDRAIKK